VLAAVGGTGPVVEGVAVRGTGAEGVDMIDGELFFPCMDLTAPTLCAD
jgi:hypothetical protein